MEELLHLVQGRGRTKVELSLFYFGTDVIVYIFNRNAHSGAIGIGEYDKQERRASVSVITRRGHKDDVIAQRSAYLISKHLKRPCCVIAGVHVDAITLAEINKVLANADVLLNQLLAYLTHSMHS